MREEVNPASGRAEIPYRNVPVFREEHAEGRLTKIIEQQAAKLPSVAFLTGAFAAMALSLAAELAGRTRASRFVGLWPAPLLCMGIYTKLVKELGAR
jgi:hypothetical protein